LKFNLSDFNKIRREDVITFVDNKSTTAATADELMQMLMEDDGTDRPIIFTVFEAANIDGVRHLSSKSRCTRLAFMKIFLKFVWLLDGGVLNKRFSYQRWSLSYFKMKKRKGKKCVILLKRNIAVPCWIPHLYINTISSVLRPVSGYNKKPWNRALEFEKSEI